VAYVLEHEYGITLPKPMQIEFGKIINDVADARGEELAPAAIYQTFVKTYLETARPFQLEGFRTETHLEHGQDRAVTCIAKIRVDGELYEVSADGNGPIDAFMRAIKEELVPAFELVTYAEHSLGYGSEAEAMAYIQIKTPSGATFFGAGTDTNIDLASIRAILSGLNRAFQSQYSALQMVAK
jgi:2-isopropylmalate synthase